jgi:hypothetical protein
MPTRIAVQLFGHLRSFRKTYKSFLKHVVEANKVDGYEVDIFIHTWTETDHSDIVWHNPTGKARGTTVKDTLINKIKWYYNSKKILMETQIDVIDYKIPGRWNDVSNSYKRILNVAYTVYKASELRREYAKEYNIKYDYIIVTRPDILFYKPFLINNVLSVYKKHNIDIPSNALFFADRTLNLLSVDDIHFRIASDILYFGSEKVIDKATNLFKTIQIDNENIESMFKNEQYHYNFEYIWFNHWLTEGLTPHRIRYQFGKDFVILRTFENKFKNNYKKYFFYLLKFIIKMILPYGIVMIKDKYWKDIRKE